MIGKWKVTLHDSYGYIQLYSNWIHHEHALKRVVDRYLSALKEGEEIRIVMPKPLRRRIRM